ncbi:MAG: glucosylglycerol 3-phosphatase [Pseudohaliea sp.]
MTLHTFHLCPDHTPLAEGLLASERLLIIQDLDGVCMGLVRDPRYRAIEQRYVEASRALAGHFFVLTNGEHIGSHGVDGIIEAAFDDPGRAPAEGCYLPGLAGGGVQQQDAFGRVSHPGVSAEELHFLHGAPGRARRWLDSLLRRPPHALAGATAAPLVEACVLDNAISPTLNLNPVRERLAAGDGELLRPSVDPAALDNPATRWDAVAGITDPEYPLKLNFLFPGGHRQYVDFFCGVARRWRERPCHAAS